MGVVAYIDYTDTDNDTTIAAIETDADPEDVTLRVPGLFTVPDADPLETLVYVFDADTDILDACTAVGVTAISADAFVPIIP